MTRLRVVYVIGKGRSGSTLLDDVLGSLPGVTSLGEVRRLWDRHDEPGYTCTCGLGVRDCPVWGPAIRAAAGKGAGSVDHLAREQAAVHAWWRLPATISGHVSPRGAAFGQALGRLYESIAASTDATTLVDSSKWPAHVGLFGGVPDVEPWILHLVRDPRAVAHSYTRVRSGTGQLEMPRFGPIHSATSWMARNLASEAVARSVDPERRFRLRYEDLAASPRETLRRLGSWLRVDGSEAPWVDDRTLHLGPAHLVGGNPRRFDRGDVVIQPDDAWRRRADSRAVNAVAALTRPLRGRYGYLDL